MAVKLTGFDDANLSVLNTVLQQFDNLQQQLKKAQLQIARLITKNFPPTT